ncbi:MAG TPA: BTAD domain-containing putative transcriptional regulator [Ktedonobacteraceae bacterium]
MTSTLRISLLGNFLLSLDDIPVTNVSVPRMQTLLTYLLLQRHAPQERSRLAFLLWPDSTDAQAHTNLRKLLYQLRQAFPESERFIHVDKQTLHWHPVEDSFILDVQVLEEACTLAAQAEQAQKNPALRQALEQAMQVYPGDLLPGCYEEWILPERNRLRQLFLAAAQRLIALLAEEREYATAITRALQLLRHDPLDEATYRQLMHLHALRGDRAAALRAYHTCAQLLERELGTEPSEITRAVYTSLMRSESSLEASIAPQIPQRAEAPLQGRKMEWRQLQRIWYSATGGTTGHQGGKAQLVLLTGEAGIGKTRLAHELELWVSRLGLTTASARCYATPSHLAFAPVTSWLRSDALRASLSTLDPTSLTEIARLVPEVLATQANLSPPASMSEGWQHQFFFAALARAILSAQPPLLLLLDDLQWCDQETLHWLHYLLHFSPRARLLLLGTVRAEETLPEQPLVAFLAMLQHDGLVTEIPLGPLSEAETSALAASLLGEQFKPDMGSNLYRETEGNPLFVVEMAQASVQHTGSAPSSPQSPLPLLTRSTSALPPAVQAVLATRLAQLSTRARLVANLAAVIGREFAFPVLVDALEGQDETVVQGLDELWQRRIVREHNAAGSLNAYDFSHDKIREHIYASLSPVLRRSFHLQVARAFQAVYAQDLDAVCGQIAAHYERAGQPVLAAASYHQAGQVATRIYAHKAALDNFEKAVTLLSPQADSSSESNERTRTLLAPHVHWETLVQAYASLGDAYMEIASQEEAYQTYQRAMAGVPAEAAIWRARLYRKIATTYTYSFARSYDHLYVKSQQAFTEAERILTQSPAPGNPDWRDEWLELQFARVWRGSVDQVSVALEKARPVVEQHGTQEQRKLFAEAIGIHNAIRSNFVIPARRVAAWRASVVTLEPGTSDTQRGMDLALLGIGLLCAAQFEEAEEQLRQAFHLGKHTGNAWLQNNCLIFLPFTLRARGQVEETRRMLEHAQSLGLAQNNRLISGHLAWLAWRAGDWSQAESHGRASLQEVQTRQIRPNPFLWSGRWPLIGIALARQQTALAIDEIRLLFEPTQQPPREPMAALLTAVLQAWDAETPEQAHKLLQEALALATEMGYL